MIKSLLGSTPEKLLTKTVASTIIPSHENGHDDKNDPHTVATHPWMNADERWQRSNASSNITDLVRSVVQDIESGVVVPEEDYITSSLTTFLRQLEHPPNKRSRPLTTNQRAPEQNKIAMPPFDAALTVLRWTKTSKDDNDTVPMDWMTHILPREMFQQACQRVYFAIEDHDEADFILANSYLARIFAQYMQATELEDYGRHSASCRFNLRTAMSSLPLHAQPSLETTAALAVSAFTAIESSQASMAWNFISAALNMSQTLGYHWNSPSRNVDPAMQDLQNGLFWIIYRLERSLALRFNRSSNIRDSEITVPENPANIRHIRLGRIHGKIYDLLYSDAAVAKTNAHSRCNAAEVLAGELQEIIQGMKDQLRHTSYEDPMKRMSLLCDIICQSSTLTLIFRAATPSIGTSHSVSDRCIATCREVLDMHHQCMTIARNGSHNKESVAMYTNWNLVHVPFVPFIIVFYRALQFFDLSDLAYLERFAASLRSEIASSNSTTHTFQLYEVLYQTARLHIAKYSQSAQLNPFLSKTATGFASHLEFAQFGADAVCAVHGSSPFETTSVFDFDSWCYDNQQMMNLLDDNTWV